MPPRRIISHPRPLAALLFVAAAAAIGLGGCRGKEGKGAAEATPARVILVTADALRWDRLHGRRPGGPPTPNLDRLAKESVVFDGAVSSAPWTMPSIASIMTGVSPAVHRVVSQRSRLPDELKTLAEWMKESGRATAAFGTNLWLLPAYNFNQGFDHYDFYPKWDAAGGAAQEDAPTSPRGEFLAAAALDWMKANAAKKSFAWIHVFQPHTPYEPPPEFQPKGAAPERIGQSFQFADAVLLGKESLDAREREWIERLYDGEVRALDRAIGALVDGLRAADLYDDALIVFTSDHGEEFWEHGAYGHGHALNSEHIHVPFILKLPGGAAKGPVPDGVGAYDLMPTILSLCGVKYDAASMTAADLSPYWLSNAAKPPRGVMSSGTIRGAGKFALSFGGMRLVVDYNANTQELFDLPADPGEKASISAARPEKMEAMKAELAKIRDAEIALAKLWNIPKQSPVPVNPRLLKEMRKLGYVN